MASTKRQRAISTLGAGMTLLCALNVHATAGTYRWMDEQGRVHFCDRMPPESADRAYSVINPHGITVKSIDKAKTPEQLAVVCLFLCFCVVVLCLVCVCCLFVWF